MLTNTDARSFDVIEVTNEMPVNRIGGVGTVIEHLMTGFAAIGVRALWFLTEHAYSQPEVQAILTRYPAVAVGTHEDLARFQAPVVHLHAYALSDALVDALATWPVLFTIHSLLVEEERFNDVDLSQGVRWQEKLIRRSVEVVLTSQAERQRYKRLGYDALNPRAAVVHNGIRIPDGPRRRRADEVLGYCGRLVPRKHPEYVQMILLEDGFERCRTLMAGKAFSLYARDLVARLGIERRVSYLGWCGGPRLDAFYRAVDVLAVPSTYEPFGLAALEASARGIPVVCTRVDGLVEILGEYAFYCDGSSYEEFRDAMRRWRRAGPAEIEYITAGAGKRQRERFTDIAMAEAYRDRITAMA